MSNEKIWEIYKVKEIKIKGNGKFKEIREEMVVKNKEDMEKFIEKFII